MEYEEAKQCNTKDEAIAYLCDRIEETTSREHALIIAEAIVDSFMEQYVSCDHCDRPGMLGLLIASRRWVIRSEDLKLSESFFNAAKIALCVYAATNELSISIIVDAIASAYSLFRNVRMKGARLTKDQCLVLIGMKEIGRPVSCERLACRLEWEKAKTENVLGELKAISLADGTTAAMVSQNSRGNWAAAGI